MPKVAALVLAAALAAACRSASPAGSSRDAGQGNAAPAAESTATAIRLAVTGGPDSGVYEVGAPAGACWTGLSGAGSLGVRFSPEAPADTLRALQVVVHGAPGRTGAVHVNAAFGAFPEGRTLEIETRAGAAQPAGEAAAEVLDSGDVRLVLVEGRTEQGIGIAVRVRCPSVGRLMTRHNASAGDSR